MFAGTARKAMRSVDAALDVPEVYYVGNVQGHISRRGQRAFCLLAHFAKRNYKKMQTRTFDYALFF